MKRIRLMREKAAPDAIKIGDHYYKAFRKEKISWSDAALECRRMGGYGPSNASCASPNANGANCINAHGDATGRAEFCHCCSAASGTAASFRPNRWSRP